MTYRQITSEERYMLAVLRKQAFNQSQIAAALGRDRSTISREIRRNSSRLGHYRPSKAIEKTNGRRSRSRRNQHFTTADFNRVERLLGKQWSPEQIAGHLREHGLRRMSHETIYKHIWRDKAQGGSLWTDLRGARKRRRKRYGAYDSRGRLAGKRHISERPACIEQRSRTGDYEIDTVMGTGNRHCIISLVERKFGYVMIGKLTARTKEQTNRRLLKLLRRTPGPAQSITADNGTEFHDYKDIESATGVHFYFATPYHSWERGTNENTNGLIRQYLPKGTSMARLTQHECNAIARKLDTRPRKRLGYRTPEECFNEI